MPTFVAPSTGNHPGSPRPSRVIHERPCAVHVARACYGSIQVSCVRPPGRFTVCAGNPAISQGRNQKLPATHRHSVFHSSAPSPAHLTGKPFRAFAWLSFSPSSLRSIAEGCLPPGCPRHRGTHSPRRPWLNELRNIRFALRPPRVDLHHFVREGLAVRPSLSSSPVFVRRDAHGARALYHVEHPGNVVVSDKTSVLVPVVAGVYADESPSNWTSHSHGIQLYGSAQSCGWLVRSLWFDW